MFGYKNFIMLQNQLNQLLELVELMNETIEVNSKNIEFLRKSNEKEFDAILEAFKRMDNRLKIIEQALLNHGILIELKKESEKMSIN